VCNREAPGVAQVAQQFAERVEVIGVASRDGTPAMEEFVARHELDHVRHIADVEGQVWQRYGIVGQPAWVFLDGGSGKTERVLGQISPDDLRTRLEALAAG
jgi:peroxiredoxin